MHGNIKDIAGKRFGRLLVIGPAPSPDEYARWACICDCGNEFVGRGHTLRNGRTRSCGCLARETSAKNNLIHGATIGGKVSREYNSWSSMKERCTNRKHPHFKNYGGRGVKICERWHEFRAFLADMGPRPAGRSLDRIDPTGNYEPGNCRWATRSEQNKNTRKAHAKRVSSLIGTTPQTLHRETGNAA